jgi:hypothetical protein
MARKQAVKAVRAFVGVEEAERPALFGKKR